MRHDIPQAVTYTKAEQAAAAVRCQKDIKRALAFLRDRGWITNGKGKGTRVKFDRKEGTLAVSSSGELMFSYRIRETPGKLETYSVVITPNYWGTIKPVEDVARFSFPA